MSDLIYVAITLGFFGLCALFVRACDRLIASSIEDEPDTTAEFREAA